jgi:hypothetical protein
MDQARQAGIAPPITKTLGVNVVSTGDAPEQTFTPHFPGNP